MLEKQIVADADVEVKWLVRQWLELYHFFCFVARAWWGEVRCFNAGSLLTARLVPQLVMVWFDIVTQRLDELYWGKEDEGYIVKGRKQDLAET